MKIIKQVGNFTIVEDDNGQIKTLESVEGGLSVPVSNNFSTYEKAQLKKKVLSKMKLRL